MNPRMSVALAAIVLPCSFAAPAFAQAASTAHSSDTVYVAHLQPVNTSITGGKTTGEARFEIKGDSLIISVKVEGAPPGIIHWQHFHGFKDDHAANCPAQSADANGDGIIDLIETEPAAGTTMVPFDEAPAAMDVAHGTYPTASEKGAYDYHKTVSVKALTAAFEKAFDGQKLDLDRRVVFIHGVPADTKLPSSVASLGPVPAHVTLPIACGKIERVKK